MVVSSVVLLRRYRPELHVDGVHPVVGAETRWSPQGWVRLHEVSLQMAVWSASVWSVMNAALVRVRSVATTVMLVTSALTVIGCVAAWWTWGLVRWDQIAVWTVTTGEPVVDPGLWPPAVSDEVRFLIAGRSEMGQDAYFRALLVHLLAPVVAAGALCASWRMGRRELLQANELAVPGARTEPARS